MTNIFLEDFENIVKFKISIFQINIVKVKLNMKLYVALIISTFLFLNNLFSQSTVLVQGKVIDSKTNNPSAGKIHFKTNGGITSNSLINSKDGAYSVVLKSGETYNVDVDNSLILSNNNMFSLPKSDEYKEVIINFTTKKLILNEEIFSFNFFAANKSLIVKNSERSFEDIKEFTELFKNIRIKVQVSCEDSKFKSSSKKVLDSTTLNSKKKKYTKITISADDNARKLASERIETLKLQFAAMGMPINKFIFEYTPNFAVQSAPKATDKSDTVADNKKVKSENKSSKQIKPNVKLFVAAILN
ncbi:MAG: hypothetical protein NT007_04820 [Candidatus Kapabacteria bacterium]|nr:hypothetical protein [Candidatus Kapabacteria bacterium]